MKLILIISIFILLVMSKVIGATCSLGVLSTFPFILEYAVWRGWTQTLLLSPGLETGCTGPVLRLVKCLSLNGAAVSWGQPGSRKWAPARTQRLAVLLIAPPLMTNNSKTDAFTQVLKELNDIKFNNDYYDWLIATRTERDFKRLAQILAGETKRFDQNIVVGFPSKNIKKIDLKDVCPYNFIQERQTGTITNPFKNRDPGNMKVSRKPNLPITSYYKASQRFIDLVRNHVYRKSGQVLPLLQSGSAVGYNYSSPFTMRNITEMLDRRQGIDYLTRNFSFIERKQDISRFHIHVVQFFVVRENSTLYGDYLGIWTADNSMSEIKPPFPVEARNFAGQELHVGRCNYSADESPMIKPQENSANLSQSASVLLDDVLHYLAKEFKAKISVKTYSKLGFRSLEGTWTGLLGALVDNTVDIALEPVTTDPAGQEDVDFIFPIAETMCNIYIRQQETSTVRDIFLAPFSWRLIVCVVTMAVLAACAVTLISRVTPVITGFPPMEFSESLLWATGILCQQGVNRTPQSPSSSMLLIACLLFAVVTYNAYAAFITSVLSVRVASVDTVAAVLHSDRFKIGYIRDGADQMYLMSTKDAQLNAFYIRGYLSAENLVSSAEEGLSRAASSDYAFFAEQRSARSTLRSMSQARGRCALRELAVPSTRTHLAFPMTKGSPYARVTLVSLLRLRSSGSVARLGTHLIPSMPTCASPTGFASARANDVRSALLLIAVGLLASGLVGLGEYIWKYRRTLRRFMRNQFTYLIEKQFFW